MNKNILLLLILCVQTTSIECVYRNTKYNNWNRDGIYIVNNSEGTLRVQWDPKECPINIQYSPQQCTSMAFIPVLPGRTVTVGYIDDADDHANMPTCRGKKTLSFKTHKNIIMYEITGDYREDIGAFNKAGKGIHCFIEINQRLTAEAAQTKYPQITP